jgi:hypothetical protein
MAGNLPVYRREKVSTIDKNVASQFVEEKPRAKV